MLELESHVTSCSAGDFCPLAGRVSQLQHLYMLYHRNCSGINHLTFSTQLSHFVRVDYSSPDYRVFSISARECSSSVRVSLEMRICCCTLPISTGEHCYCTILNGFFTNNSLEQFCFSEHALILNSPLV